MQISGIGLNTKAELKNIKSLFRVGEIIEVKIVAKKGETLYLLEAKGNIFEGVANKEIDSSTLQTEIQSVQPEVVMINRDKDGLEIKLTSFLGKAKRSDSNILKQDVKNIVINQAKADNKAIVLFEKGSMLKAEILGKGSDNTYILKIGKAVFEALAKLDTQSIGSKLTLLVEKVTPNIVLRVVGRDTDVIEYVKGGVSVAVESAKSDISIIFDSLSDMEQALAANDKKSVLVNTQKILGVIENLEKVVVDAKGDVETLKHTLQKEPLLDGDEFSNLSRNIKNLSKGDAQLASQVQRKNSDILNRRNSAYANYAKNTEAVTVNKKTDINILLKLINESVSNTDEKAANLQSIIEDFSEKIDKIVPLISSVGASFSGLQKSENNPQSNSIFGFLKELEEGLDKVLNGFFRFEDSVKTLEKSVLGNNFHNTKELAVKIKEFAQNELFGRVEKTYANRDTDKIVDNIRNVLQQIKPPQTAGSLFVQIPISIGNKESKIYVDKEQKNKSGSTKKSYKIKIVSEYDSKGVFQIEGLYLDGNISCRVGFDNKERLEMFEKGLKELSDSLGKNTAVSTFLIKSKPVIIQKKLNIKI